MSFIIFLSVLIHLSVEECVDSKVYITTELADDTTVVSLKAVSENQLWHVAILKKGESEGEFLCSGTIVGNSHVLTAASCVLNVASSELRVVAGLTLLHDPSHDVENPHRVFTVTKKYYPFHKVDLNKNDLAVLKLENKAIFKTAQLTAVEATDKYSKQCFSLGFGVRNHTSADPPKCPNPSFQDSINSVLYYTEQNKPTLNKILAIRNFMGLSSMFIFQLSRMLNIFPRLPLYEPTYKYSQDVTCSETEFTTIKAVRMSTKHPYKCMCRNTNRICLYSTGIEDIAHQVDIGSPVFCRLKHLKSKSKFFQPNSSKFVLAGIITNKKTEEVRWLKYSSSINMLTATNVTSSIEFVLAVMLDKN